VSQTDIVQPPAAVDACDLPSTPYDVALAEILSNIEPVSQFERVPIDDEVAEIGSRFIRGADKDLVKRTMKHIVYDVRIGENTKKAFNFSVKQLIAQKKMKKPYDPDQYFDFSFINNTMKNHPEWFADLSKS